MIVCLMGVPASGKTTLVKRLISEHSGWNVKKYKKLRFMMNVRLKVIIFGIYQVEGTFIGTDLLTMDILKDSCEFLDKFTKAHKDYNFLIEGDRFNCGKFFDYLKSHIHKIFVVKCDDDQLRTRHFARGNTQSEQFKKRCSTKIGNLMSLYKYEPMDNNNEEQAQVNIETLKRYLEIIPRAKNKGSAE